MPASRSAVIIEMRLQRPYVDIEACIGCGICEHECPVSGLRAIRISAEGETRSSQRRLLLKVKNIFIEEVRMGDEINKLNRRDFLKTAGGAGLASLFATANAFAEPNSPKAVDPNKPIEPNASDVSNPQVPRRKLGKTGIEVPILNLRRHIRYS